MKKRGVFLFGAGAVLEWGGPTTLELTKLVRESGFPIADSKTKVTEFIYQKLISFGYSPDEINFETIISVIEELIIFYSEFDKEKQIPSILAPFFSFNWRDELLNYNIKGGKRVHGYTLQIPKGKDYNYSQRAYNNENPDQFYFQHLLSLIITVLCDRISEYSWHTTTHSVINLESESSLLFRNWIKVQEENRIVRAYTLNYDRLFKVLASKEKIDLFEGYEDPETAKPGCPIRAEIPRILSDFDTNIFYNLHGSAFWNVRSHDHMSLPNPEIVFYGTIHLPVNDETVAVHIDKGSPFLVTNIITGYQKAQKGYFSPVKQMQSSFDKDCCAAEKLFIIGYSFGDESINQSIKTALRYNPKLKIEIIDPSFIDQKMNEEFSFRFFSFLPSRNINPKKVSKNIYSYYDDKILINAVGFADYLKMKKSTKIN